MNLILRTYENTINAPKTELFGKKIYRGDIIEAFVKDYGLRTGSVNTDGLEWWIQCWNNSSNQVDWFNFKQMFNPVLPK